VASHPLWDVLATPVVLFFKKKTKQKKILLLLFLLLDLKLKLG
jgi:hypothetical protein